MSKKNILNFLVALKNEALPIIDYYNLTPHNKKFKNIFSNLQNKVFLIISGIGMQNAKKAAINLIQINHNKDNLWVNIGIAGHQTYKIGSIYEVKKVISSIHKNTFFTNSFYNKLPTCTVCCVDEEEKKFKKKYLYDMESYGFLEVLDNLTIKENIFIFKVVSDNIQFKPDNYKKFAISVISKYIDKVNAILNNYRCNSSENFSEIALMLDIIKKKYHVTYYNEKKLEKILIKISIIKKQKEIINEVSVSKSLNRLIQNFERHLADYILKI